MLNSDIIERTAVMAIERSIVLTQCLFPYINQGDKEPSWDGNVYIYKDTSNRKDMLYGRMPTQVKGKECNDHSKKTISYSVDVADLQNYLNDGGCMFFVVYINKHNMEEKIYYSALTPMKLRALLFKLPATQVRKTISLDAFPDDNNEKRSIFMNCYQHCHKQASFADSELLSYEQLKKLGLIDSLVVPVAGAGLQDPQLALIDSESYVYAKLKGSNVLQPLRGILKDISTQQKITADVTIDGKKFYNYYRVIKSKNEIEMCLGESFRIIIDRDTQYGKISYTNTTKMRALATDLEFMLAYIENEYFNVGEDKINLELDTKNFADFILDDQRKLLEYVKKVDQLLIILGVTEDIDMTDMQEMDWRNLDLLIKGLVEKEKIRSIIPEYNPIVTVKIGNLNFIIYMHKIKEETDELYIIKDFFKANVEVVGENNKEKLQISQFWILETEDFLKYDNIDFTVLIKSFKEKKTHSETYKMAINYLNRLLRAYDKEASGIRKTNILNACNEFAEWISAATDSDVDIYVRDLNVLQTIKRSRELTTEEEMQLYDITEAKSIDARYRVVAHLLLGNESRAKILFNKLSEEQQDDLRRSAIMSFMGENNS